MSEKVIIHTDGASRGNPGPAAFAYTIARPGQPLFEEAGRLVWRGDLTAAAGEELCRRLIGSSLAGLRP